MADIAAGIARRIWKESSLVQLARVFEYVTYNGSRLSEAKAAAFEDALRSVT